MEKSKSHCPDLGTNVQMTGDSGELDQSTDQKEAHSLRKQDVIQDLKLECDKIEKVLKADTEFLDRIRRPSQRDKGKHLDSEEVKANIQVAADHRRKEQELRMRDVEADLVKRCEKLWLGFYGEAVKAHKVLETEQKKRERQQCPPLTHMKPSGQSGQKALKTAPKQVTRVSRKTVKRVLELLCDEMCFLIQSDTLGLLASQEEDQQTLLKSDLILSAIGIRNEDELYELVNFILNYRKHGREQEKKRMESSSEQGEMEEELADLINRNDILPAVKEFIAQSR